MEEERQAGMATGPRHAYPTTGGTEVYVEDREIVTVTTVTTQKHGAVLILRLRDGEKLWVLDTERSRLQLRMGSPTGILKKPEKGS